MGRRCVGGSGCRGSRQEGEKSKMPTPAMVQGVVLQAASADSGRNIVPRDFVVYPSAPELPRTLDLVLFKIRLRA